MFPGLRFPDKLISGSVKLSAALALMLLLLAAGAPGAHSAASIETRAFDPIQKKPRTLVFDLRGVDPSRIVNARARMQPAHRQMHRQLNRRYASDSAAMRRAHRRAHRQLNRNLKVARVRSLIREGKPLRLRASTKIRGGKVKVKESKPVSLPSPPQPPPEPPTGEVHPIPASVPTGCTADATNQIRSWIASVPDNSTVRFGAGACYRIEGTIELKNRTLTLDGNGSTFKSLDPPGPHRAFWRAWGSNVAFRDMTITGSYTNGGVHDEDLQWAHAIDLRGSRGHVIDVAMSDLAGDCVYFGLGASRSSGTVRDSSCRRIGRNGVSVVAGDDILVERTTTDRIGYIAFDVEPNNDPGDGSSRVAFDSNTIGSYFMKAYTVIGTAPISDQAFTNNTIVAPKGLEIGVVDEAHRPRALRISGNTAERQAKHNAINLEGINGLTVTGNTVPVVNGGTMAQVRYSCDVAVAGNTYPAGSREVLVLDPRC